MPIVTHTWEGTPQANGDISYVLRMSDQEGNVAQKVGILPAGVDPAAFIALKIAERNEQLAEEEFEAIVGGG